MEKVIEFHASRIIKGNPVKGVFIFQDEEWLTVRLLKNIEGMANVWKKGEEKTFRKSLIYGTIKGL
jgi:hypothetical protein